MTGTEQDRGSRDGQHLRARRPLPPSPRTRHPSQNSRPWGKREADNEHDTAPSLPGEALFRWIVFLLLSSWLLFAHGCHAGDHDDELFTISVAISANR